MMGRKIFLLNLLLLSLVAVLAQHLVSSWKEFERAQSLQSIAREKAVPSGPGQAESLFPLRERTENLAEFLVIAEKNLFTPERSLESEEGQPEEEQAPRLAKEPELIGVLMMGADVQAYLNVYEGRNAQGETRTVRVGDQVQGYTVTEISEDQLVLSWKDQQLRIGLSTGRPAPRQTASNRAGAVTVITVGSSAAAVETSASGEAEEARGLEVSVVGAAPQQGRGAAGQGLRGGAGRPGQGGGLRGRGANARPGLNPAGQNNENAPPTGVPIGGPPPPPGGLL